MEEKPRMGVFGRSGPRRPHLAQIGTGVAEVVLRGINSVCGYASPNSRRARSQLAALEETIRAGREAYLLGFGAGTHNAGAALVRVTAAGTVELVCNEEEERYTAVKHCTDYPEHSVDAVLRRLGELGVEPSELAACVSCWDYAGAVASIAIRPMLEEAPASLTGKFVEGMPESVANENIGRLIRQAPRRLMAQLGIDRRTPVVGVRHHDSHAYFSYAVSPFAGDPEPVMVLVLDGSGDDATISLYEAHDGAPKLLETQGSSTIDSLGTLYGFLSSTQGGWPIPSSEGRYMGAAAWGNGDRFTNGYYRRLREIVHLGPEGEVRLNRALANWPRAGLVEPYTPELTEILGEPVPLDQLWHPDAVLNVEDVRHPEVTRDRVDKAAAVQMVFEDALAHVVEHLIRLTGSDRLVMTGGAALNCVANTRLLECFDGDWYERQLGRSGSGLNLWVPPTPGDAGTPMGAAYAFAMRAGAKPGGALQHAFYCGSGPPAAEVEDAVAAEPGLESISLGRCDEPEGCLRVADLLAHLVAGDRIVGLCQGASETGPRALGHRSILANPCNPETRSLLNERVKHRELIRPLAPMLTRAAAERLFELQPGAAADDYNAYNYMVLTARARPEAHALIPSVIHRDGTGRLQIVRPESDPLTHAYLVAMGRRVGVEASVNTSLNVGAPIAHTAAQAVATLRRAKGMDGLLLVDAEGEARLLWLRDRAEARQRLLDAVQSWAAGSDFELPALASV